MIRSCYIFYTITISRFASCLALDHISALYPNADTPFEDAVDVVNRLLPYHVFQHPNKDLDTIAKGDKGKRKATNQDLVDEITGMSLWQSLTSLVLIMRKKQNLH